MSILRILSLALVLIASGCSSGKNSQPEDEDNNTYIGGNTGLRLEFLDNSPPQEVTDRGTFPFQAIVVIKNQGETNIVKNDIKVNLVGIDPQDFMAAGATWTASDLQDRNPLQDLTPMQKDLRGDVLDSPEVFISFPQNTENFSYSKVVSANSEFVFGSDICYKYQTKAASELCILEDTTNPPADAICKPRGDKPVVNSGSPLKVTSFRQNEAGKSGIQFSVDVSHVGSGKLFKLGVDDPITPENEAVKCPKDPIEIMTSENIISIAVDTSLAEGSALSCDGLTSCTGSKCEGELRLFNNEGTITCTQELPGRDIFLRPVQIVLDYNYFDKTDTKVLVRKSGGTMTACNSNGICDPSETPATCASDCTTKINDGGDNNGDGDIDSGDAERPDTAINDEKDCGNELCDGGETPVTCTSDCFPALSTSFFDATTINPDARGFQHADFESKQKRVIFYPWGGTNTDPLGVVLAYHTDQDFLSPTSYQAVDLTSLIGPAAEGFGCGCTDDADDYVYFVPFRKDVVSGTIEKNGLAIRFDTSKDISDKTAYDTFDLETTAVPRIGWATCVYLSDYIYYMPVAEADTYTEHGTLLRYNTNKAFDNPTAWEYASLELIVDTHAIGFQSTAAKDPYVYLIPFDTGSGLIVRYNTKLDYYQGSSYEKFDLTTLHSDAKGFTGGMLIGNILVLVPWRDLSNPIPLNQIMSVAAAFDTTKDLDDISAWTFFDLTRVEAGAKGYQGGWADRNGFVSFVPQQRGFGIVPPFIVWNSSKPFDDPDSWKTYDSSGVIPSTGVAYDDTTNTAWLAPFGIGGNGGKITKVKLVPK